MNQSKIFAIYKPKGPTSNDIVQKIRRITGIKKVGHAGTLDPLATGVLVVGVGREATKKLGDIVKKEKEYIATIKLGMTSTTDDAEGSKQKILEPAVSTEASREGWAEGHPKLPKIKTTLKQFQGKIKQVPPIFSAIKVKGKEAYKLARKGQKPKLEARLVEIKKIEILTYRWPYLKLKVITGPGFYVRSLARDIGEKLQTGAYLSNLERTRVGQFTKEKSIKLDQLHRLLNV